MSMVWFPCKNGGLFIGDGGDESEKGWPRPLRAAAIPRLNKESRAMPGFLLEAFDTAPLHEVVRMSFAYSSAKRLSSSF